MLTLYRSNRAELLAQLLATQLQLEPPGLFEPVQVIVNTWPTSRWLGEQIALGNGAGIAANLRFPFPSSRRAIAGSRRTSSHFLICVNLSFLICAKRHHCQISISWRWCPATAPAVSAGRSGPGCRTAFRMATNTYSSRPRTVDRTMGLVKLCSTGRRFLPTSRLSSSTAAVP